ncbi:MAG: ABC transporter substrate-binding protein [Phototrophicaceae bacterium]
MNKFRPALLVVLLLLLPLTFIHAQEGVLRVGVNAPVQLDPHVGTNDPEILLNRQIYDYLIDISPTGELIPQLATDWTIREDGLTYALTLVEGVTFSDGTPFSAADVVFSFDRLKSVGSPALNLLGEFEVAADGESAVTFTLPSPNADFLFGIGSRWSFILKNGVTEVNTGDVSNFIGTGPFILTSYSEGVGAELAANPTYWIEGQPQVAGLSFVFIEDSQAQIDAFRAGSLDFIFKVAADRIGELRAAGLNVVTRATNQHPVIRLRSDAGFLGEDPRVMQALKLATDRELLVLDLFGEMVATVGNNDPIGPVYGEFYTPIEQAYDPVAACALLAEAGFPEGLGADEPLQFYVVDSFNYSDMAELLQAQWSETGCINVEILVRPENVYYGDNEWLDAEFGVTGWGSRPIPQQYLVEAYITAALPENGGFNESRLSIPALDELVTQASVTADIAARAEIYAQISQIFAEQGSVIIPFFAPTVGVIAEGVEGIDLHSFPGSTDFRTATVSR